MALSNHLIDGLRAHLVRKWCIHDDSPPLGYKRSVNLDFQ